MKIVTHLYRRLKLMLSEAKFMVSVIGSGWNTHIHGKAGLHHIGLNVKDVDSTQAFYEKYFGTKFVKYNNTKDALSTGKLLFLMNVNTELSTTQSSSCFWHIGWSGVDAQHEFDWRVAEGINVHTPITPLDGDYWMYFWGPNDEVVEIYTRKKNHSFEHIHLLASDVDETMTWFRSFLGIDPVYKTARYNSRGFKWNYLIMGGIDIVVFGKPEGKESWWPEEKFKPTDDNALGHICFSYSDIEPVFKHMKKKGVDVVHEIRVNMENGHKSFFVRGPDQLLIEIVEKR